MSFIKIIISFLKDKQYVKLLTLTSSVIGLGTIMYKYLEGWNWIDCLYFSVVTLTTVGYGDIAPTTSGGKIFTIFYIIIGLGIILNFIEIIHMHYEDEKNKKNDFIK
jgi:voltage-gated potassium channel Kch